MALQLQDEVDRFGTTPRSIAPRVINARVRKALPARGLVERGGSVAWSLPRWMIRGYNEVNAGDLAAAVAFNAMVALGPSFLMLIFVGGLFLKQDDVLRTAIFVSVWAVPGADSRDAIDGVLNARRNSYWFGIASLLGFAYVGTNFVTCLARSMNRIYRVKSRRFVCERLVNVAVTVVFAILFVLAASAATIPTLFVQQSLPVYFETWALAEGRAQLFGYGLAVVAALALFVMIYRIVPNAGQRLLDVWPGTLTAALLFVGIVQAFPIYLRVIGGFNRYGQFFGFVSLLVAWFYLLAHVVLFGTYINASYQRHRRRRLGGRVVPFNGRTSAPS